MVLITLQMGLTREKYKARAFEFIDPNRNLFLQALYLRQYEEYLHVIIPLFPRYLLQEPCVCTLHCHLHFCQNDSQL